MNYPALIENLNYETGVIVKKAEKVVTRGINDVSITPAKGDRVEINGFKSFKIKPYDGRTGSNPKSCLASNVAGHCTGDLTTFKNRGGNK